MSTDTYQEFEPSLCVRPLIRCYWVYKASDAQPFTVLPDGCTDVVFDMETQCGPRLVGPMTKPVERPGGATSLMGVRFSPGGARALLATRELRSILNSEACIKIPHLEPLRSKYTTLSLLEQCFSLLASQCTSYQRESASLANLCFETRLSIVQLADNLGISRQHLRRRVVDASGLPPKTLSRIGRASRLRERLNAGVVPNADVALAAGYCDQSHMVNEFRELMGLSPGAFRQRAM